MISDKVSEIKYGIKLTLCTALQMKGALSSM